MSTVFCGGYCSVSVWRRNTQNFGLQYLELDETSRLVLF